MSDLTDIQAAEIDVVENEELLRYLKTIFQLKKDKTIASMHKIDEIVTKHYEELQTYDTTITSKELWTKHLKQLRKEMKREIKQIKKKEKEKKREKPLQRSDSDEDEDEVQELTIQNVANVDHKTISQHRKAYVKWFNEEFYKDIKKKVGFEDSSLKIYQLLVKHYLGLETPYRGLLVYHGLGTGKTATAISLSESLSSEMKITTLLPASLETNFITEIMGDPSADKIGWGQNELNINQAWKYYSFEEILANDSLHALRDRYFIQTDKTIQKAYNKIKRMTIKKMKKTIIQEDKELHDTELDEKLKVMEREIKSREGGLWIPDKDGSSYQTLVKNPVDVALLHSQIEYFISLKYNFIHYKPLPKIEKTKSRLLKEFEEDSDSDEELLLDPEDIKKMKTNNQKIVIELEKKLKYNVNKYGVNSPFFREVIIIDEVHNFVRQVLNNSTRTKVFYEWLVRGQEIKLVFLSGTPVINKPCEIAILYNMLKGLIKIYSFTIKTDLEIEEVNEKLNRIFFEKSSLIELFFVEQKLGKLVLSVIQETNTFESLLNEDSIVYTIQTQASEQDFITHVYQGLHKLFSPESILPTEKMYDNLSQKELRSVQRGVPHKFDKELNQVFNRQQKLFDIYQNDTLVDMTNHENFMNYFFEDTEKIPQKKRILLKRMLMGLTSYYPIDRSSIVDMPQIVEPHVSNDIYKDYEITKELNIIPCTMSQLQFEKYVEVWEAEKSMDAFRKMKKSFSDDDPYHYQIRTRQTCNIVYRVDDFRIEKKLENAEKEKQKVFSDLMMNKTLSVEKELRILSPKMYQILYNMNKFMNQETNLPTGKILFYSDFRSDAGSEAFELVLKANGYEKYDTANPQKTKDKRYTFITGSESPDERRISLEYFKTKENMYGELIQIIMISSAGAEGISLNGIRQVHILEPYWNYVRIDQVLGRAIRMKSHKDLPKSQQNVEQYLYLSFFPLGTTIESVYESIVKNNVWSIPQWSPGNLHEELGKSKNKEIRELINTIIRINNDTDSQSADQLLFNMMERKYIVSKEINDVIKESSLDCIQHTRDDPELNDKCIRFSDKLKNEIAYFPGISSHVLEITDSVQLKAKYLYHIKPDIYVISAADTQEHSIYIYYQVDSSDADETDDSIDVRYIRENGKRLCDLYLDMNIVFHYVEQNHPVNKKFNKDFSVYQEIFTIKQEILEDYIHKGSFPPMKILLQDLSGYKLKYNINESFYYSPASSFETYAIVKMYPFHLFMQQTIDPHKPIIYLNDTLYIQNQ